LLDSVATSSSLQTTSAAQFDPRCLPHAYPGYVDFPQNQQAQCGSSSATP
jgi:hypothetical protein